MQPTLIPPTALIKDYLDFEFQFCLTHIARQDAEYADIYAEIGRGGKHHLIMDNGAFENGTSDSLEDLLHWIGKIQPQEVVLPDRMFMADETIKMSQEAFEVIRQSDTLGYSPLLMGVAHGRNILEWRDCAEALVEMGCDTIAIPKDYEAWPGGRDILLDLLVAMMHDPVEEKYRSFNIHLLGLERDVTAPSKMKRKEWVRSIDTAKPFIYTAHRADMRMDHGSKHFPRPKNYFSLPSLNNQGISSDPLIQINIWEFQRICSSD